MHREVAETKGIELDIIELGNNISGMPISTDVLLRIYQRIPLRDNFISEVCNIKNQFPIKWSPYR